MKVSSNNEFLFPKCTRLFQIWYFEFFFLKLRFECKAHNNCGCDFFQYIQCRIICFLKDAVTFHK